MAAKKAAVKKRAAAPARAVSKVSPMRAMTVDQFIAQKLIGWQAEAASRIVALVKKAAPTSTVSIKWARPVFDHDGPLAWLAGAKAHLTFGFWRGAELSDPNGVLEGDGARMRHLKLTSLEAIDEPMLVAFVKQAVKLNGTLGDPTRSR